MLLLENLKKTIQKIAEVLKLKADKTDIVQSDWAQTDVNNKAFIRNKPTISQSGANIYYNIVKGNFDLDKKYWEVTGDINYKRFSNSIVSTEYFVFPMGTITYTYKGFLIPRGYTQHNAPSRYLAKFSCVLPPGDYYFSISGGSEIHHTESTYTLYTKDIEVNRQTFILSIKIRSNYNFNNTFPVGNISLYPLENNLYINNDSFISNTINITLNASELSIGQLFSYSTFDSNSYLYRVLLEGSNTGSIKLDSYIDQLPENIILELYLLGDSKFTFQGSNIKASPEGLILKKQGSYATIIKFGNNFIIRINNVA